MHKVQCTSQCTGSSRKAAMGLLFQSRLGRVKPCSDFASCQIKRSSLKTCLCNVQCTLGKCAAGIGKPVAERLEREDIITACPYCTGKAPVQAQDPTTTKPTI